jgi:hypothetical protein
MASDTASTGPVKVTALDNFAAACTLLGGFDKRCATDVWVGVLNAHI